MIDLERIVCFRFFDDDTSRLTEINDQIKNYRKKGIPDDVIYRLFEIDNLPDFSLLPV